MDDPLGNVFDKYMGIVRFPLVIVYLWILDAFAPEHDEVCRYKPVLNDLVGKKKKFDFLANIT